MQTAWLWGERKPSSYSGLLIIWEKQVRFIPGFLPGAERSLQGFFGYLPLGRALQNPSELRGSRPALARTRGTEPEVCLQEKKSKFTARTRGKAGGTVPTAAPGALLATLLGIRAPLRVQRDHQGGQAEPKRLRISLRLAAPKPRRKESLPQNPPKMRNTGFRQPPSQEDALNTGQRAGWGPGTHSTGFIGPKRNPER